MIALVLALATQSLEDVERARFAALEEIRRTRPAEGQGPAFEAWDRKYFDAQWEYGHALLRLENCICTPHGCG